MERSWTRRRRREDKGDRRASLVGGSWCWCRCQVGEVGDAGECTGEVGRCSRFGREDEEEVGSVIIMLAVAGRLRMGLQPLKGGDWKRDGEDEVVRLKTCF